MTISDDLTRRLTDADPVPSVSSFKPTMDEATKFLAIVKDFDKQTRPPDGDRHVDDDLTMDELQLHDPSTSPPGSRHLVGIAAAIAITTLLVIGALVVADRDQGADVADPVSSPAVNDSVASSESFGILEDQPLFRDGGMFSVNVGGPGFVAVGWSELYAPVWTSVDGTTWSRVPNDDDVFAGQFEPPGMLEIAAGGPGLVAVGSGGVNEAAAWTSVDGITWSRVHDEAVFDGVEMNSVTTGGPGLVAVGLTGGHGRRDAAVWTSVDGTSWTKVLHDEEIFGGASDQEMLDVIAGGPGLVAVGVDLPGGSDLQVAAVWTSVDGMVWSRTPHDEAVFGETANEPGLCGGYRWCAGRVMTSVTAGGPGVVAVGHESSVLDTETAHLELSAAVWTSADGITWSKVPRDEGVFGGLGSQQMTSVTVGGPGLVAVGHDESFNGQKTDAAVWTSVDGITWTRVPHDSAVFGGSEMSSVTATDAGLIAVGKASGESIAMVWTSVDGISWSRIADDVVTGEGG
jgi:hypothetical protein